MAGNHMAEGREVAEAMKRIEQSDQPKTTEETASAVDRILAAFDDEGLHNTRPRRVIAEQLALLAASAPDFTAHDLWQEVQSVAPHVGRATVYRAVDVLLRQGVLDRIPFADGTHRYRLCGSSHHHHLTCTHCQRVIEITACLPPELLATIATNTDFAIEGHSLELYGRCPTCRDAQNEHANV